MIGDGAPVSPLVAAVAGLHVMSGFLGMVGGLIPAFSGKGSRDHRNWGKVSLWSMAVAALSAFPLAYWREDRLQLVIGTLAGFAVICGMRSLNRNEVKGTFRALDAALAGLAATVGLFALSQARTAEPAVARVGLMMGVLLIGLAARHAFGLTSAGQTVRARVLDHAVATSCVLCVGWGSFLNTQLHRLTGIHLPFDVRISIPFVLAAVLLAVWMPRWSRGLALEGLATFRGTGQPSEVQRLQRLAIAEGVSFLVLLLIAVPVKRFLDEPALVRIVGPIHGTLTLLYFASVVMARHILKWPLKKIGLALFAGVVPLGTFFIHRWFAAPESVATAASGS